MYRRNERIYVDGGRLGQVDMWGRKKEWPIQSIKGAVFGPVSLGEQSELPEAPVTLVLDQSGASLMSLSPLLWDAADLDRLWQKLGIQPVQGWTAPMTPEVLRRSYPGAVRELPRSSLPPAQMAVVIAGSLVLAILLSICLLR